MRVLAPALAAALTLTATSTAHAQAGALDDPAPPEAASFEAVLDAGADERGRVGDVGRVFAQLGVGTLGLALATGVGAIAGYATYGEPPCPVGSVCLDFGPALPTLEGMGYGLILGGGVLYPLGVGLAAELVDGRGEWWGLVLGALAGQGAGAILALSVIGATRQNGSDDNGPVQVGMVALAGLLAAAGPIVGYELTRRPDTAPDQDHDDVAVVPWLTPLEGGAAVGVAGAL
jgi:MFS family permease